MKSYGASWDFPNEDFVDCWIEFPEFLYSKAAGGQNHPRWYPEDPFPVSMTLLGTRDGNGSHDAPRFGHRHPLHIERHLDAHVPFGR